MEMAPDLVLLFAGAAAAWAMLGLIGGERQQMLQNLEAYRPAEEPPPPSASRPTASQASTAAAKKPAG